MPLVISTWPPREIRAVEAARHGADDIGRIALARQHERVGHARHGDVFVALAPAAAGGGCFRDAAGKLVLQIAAQNAVFDQNVALGLVAFVVHVERAAAAADSAVVDHRTERTRHLLADASAESRNAFAIEVGFETVADGFVQQHAGPAGTEHHDLFAGRRFHGIELHDRLARGFAGEVFRGAFLLEKFEFVTAAAARVPLLRNAVAFARQHENAHAGQRLAVEVQHAVAGRDQNVAEAVGISHLDLKDARIVGARGVVGALRQFDALLERGLVGSGQDGVEIALAALFERGLLHLCRTGGDQRRDLRRVPDLLRAQIVAVGVSGALPRDDAYADAERNALGGALDDGFIDADGSWWRGIRNRGRHSRRRARALRRDSFPDPAA